MKKNAWNIDAICGSAAPTLILLSFYFGPQSVQQYHRSAKLNYSFKIVLKFRQPKLLNEGMIVIWFIRNTFGPQRFCGP